MSARDRRQFDWLRVIIGMLLICVIAVTNYDDTLATITVITVQEDGGGDHTTLDDAIGSLSGDSILYVDTTDIVISKGWGAHDTDDLDYIGIATDGLNGIIRIRTVGLSRHSGVPCDTCYMAEWTASNGAMWIRGAPWKTEGLQFFWSGASGGGINYLGTVDPIDDSVIWDDCLFQSNHKTIFSTADLTSAAGYQIYRNSLFFDSTQAGPYVAGPVYLSKNHHRMKFFNCTFSNGAQAFYDDKGCADWTAIFKNCLMSGMANGQTWDFSIDNGCDDSVTVENCAWDDSVSTVAWTDASNERNQTFTFKDSAHGTWDFHLGAADAGAQGLGVDISSETNGTAFDVDGGYRHPDFDIDIGYDQVGSGSMALRVTASADDAFRDEDDIYLTTPPPVMGDYNGADSDAGFRFLAVPIPDSSNIWTASIVLTASDAWTDAGVNLLVDMNDVDDAATFSTTTDFDNRVHTTANVAWSALPSWVQNVEYESPDFADAVHEVVDRTGYNKTNDLAVLVNNNSSTTDADRAAWDFDSEPTKSALFQVVWYEDTAEGGAAFQSARRRKALMIMEN